MILMSQSKNSRGPFCHPLDPVINIDFHFCKSPFIWGRREVLIFSWSFLGMLTLFKFFISSAWSTVLQ